MADLELMSFNDASARWFQWHYPKSGNRKQYGVAANKLRKLYPDLCTGVSKAGTRKAANQWWTNKLEELDQPTPAQSKIDQKLAWAIANGELDLAAGLRQQKELIDQFPNEKPLRISEAARAVWIERLKQPVAKPAADSTVSHHAARFLGYKKQQVDTGKRSAGHYNNLANELKKFVDWFGKDRDVSEITGLVFKDWHVHLQTQVTAGEFSEYAAKKFQGTLRAFIYSMYEDHVLAELPRNLKKEDLKFELPEVKIVCWTKEDLHFVLPYCKPHFKLWLLLMANCGFTNVDVAEIRHTDVDWKAGTITSRRSKTARSKRTPIVTFPLWKTTFNLLKQCRSKHAEFVLVNEDGNQLRVERLRGSDEEKAGKYTKYDNIQSQYFDLKLLIKKDKPNWKHLTLKQLRKTGPTLLRDSKEYNSVRTLFLRNAENDKDKPNVNNANSNITDQHYADFPTQLFNEAVLWLGKQLEIE